jgi:hypothetical protein
LITLRDFEIGGAIMLFGFLAAPWLVTLHWPRANADQRRRWLFVYRMTFGLAFLGLGLGWLVPAVGGTAFIAASLFGLCAIVYTVVRDMVARGHSEDGDA